LYIVLAFIGGIAVSTLAFFLIYRLKFKPVESGLVSSLLSNTEQEVIKAINDDSGVSTQRRICDKTGYSKSKVSQILAKLEEKDVLTRERWGRTNKVTITNPSFKAVGQSETLNKDQESSSK
ncbi:MAG: helix-turn-helix transcriptional regulator, partial [Candidatus Heimdallarchaeota archaeon]